MWYNETAGGDKAPAIKTVGTEREKDGVSYAFQEF